MNFSIQCAFGDQLTTAITSTSDSAIIMCRSPPFYNNQSIAVSLQVIVTQPAQTILRTNENITFRYIRHPFVAKSDYLSGPSTGFSTITLSGSFEYIPGELLCRFGDSSEGVVNATYLSENTIRCTSPPTKSKSLRDLPFVAPIYISHVNQDFVRTGYLFTYYSASTFTELLPISGPTSGGIMIRLRGSFPSTLASSVCLFGNSIAAAVAVDIGVMECLLPSAPMSGVTYFSYSRNGIDFEATNLTFKYFASPGLLTVYPNVGVVQGQTAVRLTVVNTFISDKWYCVFGVHAVRATTFSTTDFACNTPVAVDLQQGTVDLRLILTNEDVGDSLIITDSVLMKSTVAEGILSYSYVYPLELLTVFPHVVFKDGGTNVTITGSHLISTSDLKCVWLKSNDFVLETTALYASSNGSVSCMTPKMEFPGLVNLTVTLNNYIESASFLAVQVITEPSINAIVPDRVLQGQLSTILVEGENFHLESSMPLCGFFAGNLTLATVPATLLSNSLISCDVPNTLPVQRQLQRIRAAGPSAVSEVQAIEITAQPNQNEVQVISTKAWGRVNPIWELREGLTV